MSSDRNDIAADKGVMAEALGRLRRWGHWGSVVDVASLAIAAPAVIFPRVALTPLLLAVPAGWGIRRWRGQGWLDATPLNAPLLLLTVMLLVSLYATYSFEQSMSKIAGLVFSFGVFFAVVHFASGRLFWRWALGLFLTMESALAVVGLLGTDWLNKLPVLVALTKQLPSLALSLPGAPEGLHPNEVAGVLLWGGPPALAAMVLALSHFRRLQAGDGGLRRVLILIGPVLVSVLIWGTLLLTQSRSAWVGAAAALLSMGAVMVNRVLPFGKRGRMAVWGGVLAVGVAGVIWLGPRLLNQAAGSETITSASGKTLSVASLQSRVEIWSRAVYGIEDFSLTGMGMNTFRKIVPVLYPLFTISSDVDIAHAHNQLLQAALDLGLPGLVAYLSIWLVAGACLWRVWRRGEGLEDRAWALGLGGALLGSFVYGMTDAVALGARPGFLWWYLLGLVVGLYKLEDSAGGERSQVTGDRKKS